LTSLKPNMKHYNIPIFIPHLGCPYDCIYCDQKKIAAQYHVPDSKQLVNTIEEHLKTIPLEARVEVAFFGGNFTAVDRKIQENYLGLVQPYLQRGRVHSIRVSTRPDCIDEPALDLLANYGVKMIELGVQSLSDKVLQASARNYKSEDVYKSSHLVKERQFDLGIQLMIGLPQDSLKQDIETTHKVIELQPQAVRIYPTLVIADTPLEDMFNRGEFKPLSLDEAVYTCKEMLLLFQKENIKVIRMGLYPGEELRREGVVKTGPFHSSFGELVEQEIFKEQARLAITRYFKQYGYRTDIDLYVHPRDLSKMVGSKKRNRLDLKKEFELRALRLKVEPGSERNWVRVEATDNEGSSLFLPRLEFIETRNF
jgi:histone acetyltransferase (RNA polymerase elongator complex component)